MKISTPKGKQTRPSGEKLRAAIFNILRHYRWEDAASILEGATVADLFAGTGAWGIEAISNEANQVNFVENDPRTLPILFDNLNKTHAVLVSQKHSVPKVEVLKRDIMKAYSYLPQCRLVFADPPYGKNYFEKLIVLEEKSPRILPKGLLVFESQRGELTEQHCTKASMANLRLFNTKIYGDSAVHFFVKE